MTPSKPNPPAKGNRKPNVVYFLVDSLGMGELSSYNGCSLRGATTARIDAFAEQGMMLFNFAPETQCTPSRSALMTGRYSIRSGNQSVQMAGSEGGLVKWERTLGDIFSDAGYATSIVGKWHIGDSEGRWPTDLRAPIKAARKTAAKKTTAKKCRGRFCSPATEEDSRQESESTGADQSR